MVVEIKRQINEFFDEQKIKPKKPDIPEVIREYEESQKKGAEPSLPPVDSAGQSSESGSPPEEPAKLSLDKQASSPPTVLQPRTTAGAADENKSKETNAPPVATSAPSEPWTERRHSQRF